VHRGIIGSGPCAFKLGRCVRRPESPGGLCPLMLDEEMARRGLATWLTVAYSNDRGSIIVLDIAKGEGSPVAQGNLA
jgi:hypothetical protein